MIYLLDTNTWVEFLRQKNANLVYRIRATNPAEIHLCSVVLGELYFGAYQTDAAQQPNNLAVLTRLTSQFASLSFDDEAADWYGRIRADLTARGLTLGPNDLMIAAIALTHGATLVTHETNQFNQVTGLTLEDWHT